MRRAHKISVSYGDIFRNGTVTLLITLGTGILFGKINMMIAFMLAVGGSTLAKQNLRIKTLYKIVRLIGINLLIVGIAYIASLNLWVAIPINFITIFTIVYLNVSPYNQTTYKNFMMLYVYCQCGSISLSQLPQRLLMVIYAVGMVVIVIYREQSKIKALLPPQLGKAFGLINEQLILMLDGKFDEKLSMAISYEMNELAYVIYGSSFKKYFTTYIGKVHFHFYLNVSYFNLLLEQIYKQRDRQLYSTLEIEEISKLFRGIEAYFQRRIKREELIEQFETYLACHKEQNGFKEEVYDAIYALSKNFKELEESSRQPINQVYSEWQSGELGNIKKRAIAYFKPKSMSFNFATRMAVTLTISLVLAKVLGFYKIIWTIIPIMSITQPYVEDTRKRGWDRLESNILAAIVITIILNIVHIRWLTFAILIVAFYLYYAYKDYYHTSLFITIISMCIATVSMPITTLLFYRIVYVVIGVMVVILTSRIMPYTLEDGIHELISETEQLNEILEQESILSLEGKANLNRIREATIYSAVLSQKLYLKNKQYKNQKVDYLIRTNTEFVIRSGHRILKEE